MLIPLQPASRTMPSTPQPTHQTSKTLRWFLLISWASLQRKVAGQSRWQWQHIRFQSSVVNCERSTTLTIVLTLCCYQISLEGQPMKLRLPFSRPAESRKDVKDLIVEMTKTATAASMPGQ